MPTTAKTALADTAVQEMDKLNIEYKGVEKPESAEALQSVLAKAFHEGLTVLPLGGGTNLGVGNLPQRVGIVLDMTGLDRVVGFDPKNLNLSLEAGVNLEQVNQFLAAQDRGFFLPLDPLRSDRATIGGTYASNASGPWRQFYGTVRDLALGAQAVDAGGGVVKFGGVTVKNVSGYDLTKFFIGSAGSLCVIHRVSLRILPLPDSFSACELLLKDEESAASLLSDIRASVLVPSALVATTGQESQEVRIVAAFEGHPKAVERQNRELEQMGTTYNGRFQVQVGREAVRAWITEAFNPEIAAQNKAVFKLSVPISKGAQTLGQIRKLFADQGVEAKLSLLAGNGVLYVHLGYEPKADLLSLVASLQDRAKQEQGYALPVQAPAQVLREWGLRGNSQVDRYLLEPIKNKLDPNGILLPLNS